MTSLKRKSILQAEATFNYKGTDVMEKYRGHGKNPREVREAALNIKFPFTVVPYPPGTGARSEKVNNMDELECVMCTLFAHSGVTELNLE